MGSWMADRLLSKGHSVTGDKRTGSKAEWRIDRRMQWADSPRAVAEAADTLFVMVTDSAALEAVALGSDGFLAEMGTGKLLIDMSTVSPAVSRSLAARARERGGRLKPVDIAGATFTVSNLGGGEVDAFTAIVVPP